MVLGMPDLFTAICVIIGIWATMTALQFIAVLMRFDDLSIVQIFPTDRMWGPILRRLPFVRTRVFSHEDSALLRQDYERTGWNAMLFTSPFPKPCASLWIADAALAKTITSDRITFQKPVQLYRLLRLWGENVLTTEGEKWKIHKKVTAPSFSEENNKLVFNSGIDTMLDIMSDWRDKDEVSIDYCVPMGLRIALTVLAIAGFGRPSMDDVVVEPHGHSMGFVETLRFVMSTLIFQLMLPDSVLRLTKHGRKIRLANKEFDAYLEEMISERKSFGQEQRSGKWDLLTNLISASELEGKNESSSSLSFSELRGNIFIYLVAGHETTAHSLVFTFGLLALHPDEQDKLHQHIHSVLGDRQPTYEDFPLLTRVLAVFYEALRLFPLVPAIAKRTTQDISVTVSSSVPESNLTKAIRIPRGVDVLIHSHAIHLNPRYYKDPFRYLPERFLGDWDRDAFLPFSDGPRGCSGRKFAEAEAVAVITTLVTNYTIHLTPEDHDALKDLPVNERAQAFFKPQMRLTYTPTHAPLVFKRRH